MSTFKIDTFFPDKNLNPQGWITDFITSRLQRVGEQRSDLANLLYDDTLTDQAVKSFKISDELKEEIEISRIRSPKNKSIFLNPRYYDAVERNSGLSTKVVEDEKKLREYYQYMLTAPPNELASYVPYAHIKFCYKQANEKQYKEAEVPFVRNLKQEVSSILSDQFSRGQGVGIRKIDVSKQFPGLGFVLNAEITVSYFFSSLSLITQKISNQFIPEDQKFTYLKLLSGLPAKRQRLVLEYGYGINPRDENIKYKNKNDIVSAERKRLVLVYKQHTISVQEDGTVLIDVKYLSEAETSLFQKSDVSVPNINFLQKADYLSPSEKSILEKYVLKNKEYLEKQTQIQKFTEQQIEAQQIGGNAKELKKIQKEKELLVKLTENLSKELVALKTQVNPLFKVILINEIIKKHYMFQISFLAEGKNDSYNIKTFLRMQNPDKTFVELAAYDTTQNLSDYKDIKNKEVLQNNTLGLTSEQLYKKIIINLFDGVDRATKAKEFGHTLFFPLKALIEIIYELTPEDTLNFETPYTCFGNLTARSFNREYMVNIGDVLIEIETFQKWLYRSFDQKVRTEYSFSDILQDIVSELVPEALYKNSTGFYNKNSIGTIKHLTYYTSPNPDKKLIQELYKSPVDFTKLRALFRPERDPNSKPLIFFTQMLNTMNQYTSPYFRKYIARKAILNNKFNLLFDSQQGIPHVIIGAAKGIVKKANFSAIEQQFLATSIVQQSLADGNTKIPRLPYNITVDMVGNNLFSQAGFLAVPPNGVETNMDVSLGITGYYVVTKVNDSISPDGTYSTSVSGIWHDNPLNIKRKVEIGSSKTANGGNNGLFEYILNQDGKPFSVRNYIEDLLSLDSNTLKSLGITAQAEPKVDKTNDEKQVAGLEPPQRDRPLPTV